MLQNSNKTILIVEDEKPLRKIVSTKMRNLGYKILEATNGEEGISMAFEHKPDLILLDIFMPKVDGLEVLEKIRTSEWGKKVPIIIFTNLEITNEIHEKMSKFEPSYYFMKLHTSLEEISDKVKELMPGN